MEEQQPGLRYRLDVLPPGRAAASSAPVGCHGEYEWLICSSAHDNGLDCTDSPSL